MNAKRFLTFLCACSMIVLLWPPDVAAQRRGSGGSRGSGSGQSATPRPRSGGGAGPRTGYPSGAYRPYYGGYRGYYGYRPYYYSPYWYNGFYASFYYGLGWYPYYAGYYGYGYPWGYGYYPYGYPYRYGAWSSARIEVKPHDAQVYVDGYFVGVVDEFDGVFQRLDLPTGEHEIAVYMPGYHTYRERTLFRPGQSYHYKAVLEPLAPGAPPEPKPQPSPDARPGRGPNRGDPDFGGDVYPEGPYRQPPPDRGASGRTQPMDRPGAERRGEAGAFGTLNLRVQPADAIVQIDGERWDSPEGGSRLVVQLAAGPHRIEVQKDGFRPYSTTVQIRPGEPQTINVSLPRQD